MCVCVLNVYVLVALTSCRCVPGCSIDGATLLGKVLGVACSLTGVSHHAVGGGVGEGQPVEDKVIGGGAPPPGHVMGVGFVVGEGHHQLATLEVAAQHEGHLLHPANQSSSLHSNLRQTCTQR